jgi:hypothetical protein
LITNASSKLPFVSNIESTNFTKQDISDFMSNNETTNIVNNGRSKRGPFNNMHNSGPSDIENSGSVGFDDMHNGGFTGIKNFGRKKRQFDNMANCGKTSIKNFGRRKRLFDGMANKGSTRIVNGGNLEGKKNQC